MEDKEALEEKGQQNNKNLLTLKTAQVCDYLTKVNKVNNLYI